MLAMYYNINFVLLRFLVYQRNVKNGDCIECNLQLWVVNRIIRWLLFLVQIIIIELFIIFLFHHMWCKWSKREDKFRINRTEDWTMHSSLADISQPSSMSHNATNGRCNEKGYEKIIYNRRNRGEDHIIQLKKRKRFYSRNMLFINNFFIHSSLLLFWFFALYNLLSASATYHKLILRFAIFVDDCYRTK